MKEIIRIHLAKIAYDIELDAKKELKDYMVALERYANDSDILQDIELRITELLAERGVSPDSVITSKDVQAVRAQLGEPQEFAEPGEEVFESTDDSKQPRRLYRDEDRAILGGVLAGVSQYFGVQPIWVRLIFVPLLFASFGTALIVYVILWVVVPPARTAAEKLTLEGKEVTLAAIKSRSEQMMRTAQAGAMSHGLRKVAVFCGGLLCVGVAAVSLVVTAVAGFALVMQRTEEVGFLSTSFDAFSWYFIASVVMFVVSGLLFVALNLVLAVAAFRRNWTRRMAIAVVSIVVAGIMIFTTAFIPLIAGSWFTEQKIQQSYKTTHHELPAEFIGTKNLTLNLENITSAGAPVVTYIVSDAPRYELTYPDGVSAKLNFEQKSESSAIALNVEGESNWRHYYEPMIRIYGPSLDSLKVHGGTVTYEAKGSQELIELVAQKDAAITAEGVYGSVRAVVRDDSRIMLESATVDTLIATTEGGAIDAGVVQSAEVSQPTSCPAHFSDINNVELTGVTSGKILYNGQEHVVNNGDSIERQCGTVEIDEITE